jgi:hypothetical protein
MLATTTDQWIAVFTGATAIFGCVVAVVTFMAYRHNRHQSALRRPIRIQRQDRRFPDKVKIYELPRAIVDTRDKRVTALRFTNRSDVDLRWSIDRSRTRLYKSTLVGRPSIEDPGVIVTNKHDGTTVGLTFRLDDDESWASEETDPTFLFPVVIRQRYWLRVRGETADGHKIKGWKRVTLYKAARGS